MAVDERPEVSFFDPIRDVAMATNFVDQIHKIGFAYDSLLDGSIWQEL